MAENAASFSASAAACLVVGCVCCLLQDPLLYLLVACGLHNALFPRPRKVFVAAAALGALRVVLMHDLALGDMRSFFASAAAGLSSLYVLPLAFYCTAIALRSVARTLDSGWSALADGLGDALPLLLALLAKAVAEGDDLAFLAESLEGLWAYVAELAAYAATAARWLVDALW